MSKTILVTGGAGFIGSNFVPYFTFANRGKSDMYVYVKGQK